jgi:hypothetical protein
MRWTCGDRFRRRVAEIAALRLRHLRHGELEPRLDEFSVVQRETDWLALVFDEKLRIEHLEPNALAVGPVLRDKKQADGSLQAPRINYGKDGLTPPM